MIATPPTNLNESLQMALTHSIRFVLTMVVAVMVLVTATTAVAIDYRLIRIGTGGKQGIYYPVGGAICNLVNENRFDHGIRCLTVSTQGSISNLSAVRNGDFDFALVQSDWHHHAVNGSDYFEPVGPDTELRSVLSLHAEAFTVVARRQAEIRTFADLKGKRVNVGPPGSGNRATLDLVLQAMDWTMDDFALAAELNADDQARALCDDQLDAVIYIVGNPNRSVEDMANDCDVTLVPVHGPDIDRFVAEHPFYSLTAIPGGMYRGNPESVPTFGLVATLVASVRTDAAVVTEVVKAIFENFEQFKGMHPALAGLNQSQMMRAGLTAPLHPGAVNYYRRQMLY